MEIWKPIPWAPKYGVSDLGNVKRLAPGRRTRPGLMLSTRLMRGYVYVGLFVDGKHRKMQVHRLVMEAFAGKSDLQVNHINGIRNDNRRTNLEYVTPKQNQQHSRYVLGTFQLGEKHGNSKLTSSDIRRIFAMRSIGLTTIEIGKVMECTSSNIGIILKRKTWGHVEIDPTSSDHPKLKSL